MRFTISLIFALLLFNNCFAQNPIQRVEPPNWWVGMQHQEIQLMVYGEGISAFTPKIKNKDVVLKEVLKVENANYLFLNIEIKPTAQPGSVSIDFFKKKRKAFSHNYSILQREQTAESIQGFDASDAIYLITPDRFVNGNIHNDNMDGMTEQLDRKNKGGRHGGDIQGIRNSLDYINDLGFTAIWLNPLLENNMKEYSYHGYSTTDFYKVDPRYGSNEEYKMLADELRDKDMKLIMDMIVNHCGLYHWWMEDMPSKDWINQWEEYTETNHRKTVLQDPYVSDIDKKTFTDGWFVPTMPDLNQNNPFMAKYLIQNSIWWVEYLGLAGIRMDTYPYPDMDFMSRWTEAMMKEYPYLNIVGEEWYGEPTIVSYWQKGKVNPNGYTSELKSVMDFPLQMKFTEALNVEESWSDGFIDVYELVAHDFLYPDPMNLVIFPDNHDMSRVYTNVGEDFNKYKQAISFFLTMRGIPQIYYGTEILMGNKGTSDHGIIRSDFPGGWDGDAVNSFTNQGLNRSQIEAKNYMQKILEWRKNAEVIHSGKLMHFIPKDGIYTYFRYNDEGAVMVIFNKNENNTPIDFTRFSEVLSGNFYSGKDVVTEQIYSLEGTQIIPGQCALILELN